VPLSVVFIPQPGAWPHRAKLPYAEQTLPVHRIGQRCMALALALALALVSVLVQHKLFTDGLGDPTPQQRTVRTSCVQSQRQQAQHPQQQLQKQLKHQRKRETKLDVQILRATKHRVPLVIPAFHLTLGACRRSISSSTSSLPCRSIPSAFCEWVQSNKRVFELLLWLHCSFSKPLFQG